MPELPEVENVRAGLAKIFATDGASHEASAVIAGVELRRADLRFEMPRDLSRKLSGETIRGVRRRAKYLMIDTDRYIVLNHLGMTGSWRLQQPGEALSVHDHVVFELQDHRRLVFRDPRRFGMLDLIKRNRDISGGGDVDTHARLRNLGPEPLDPLAFNKEYLFTKSRRRQVPVKVFIMDQKVVVGVGNIYASEALFRARVSPLKKAARLSLVECERIQNAVVETLREAIAAGGSSIRDYRQADGERGVFQNSHLVYGRAGEPCVACKTPLKARVLGGRSTFYCVKCQR